MHNVRELDLSGQGLTRLPERVIAEQELEVLNLRGNRLSSLPDRIRDLPNLRELLLAQNDFDTMPALNPRLELLDISRNSLDWIPEEIGELSRLRHLDLSRNELRSLPDTMRHLRDLHTLDVSCNRLVALPFDARNIVDLVTPTTYLDFIFYGNPLMPFPPEAFGLVERVDFCDLGWLRYYRALATLNHEELAAIIEKAAADLNDTDPDLASIRLRRRIETWLNADLPQTTYLSDAANDPTSGAAL